jgi:hypothetical protein
MLDLVNRNVIVKKIVIIDMIKRDLGYLVNVWKKNLMWIISTNGPSVDWYLEYI